MPIDARYLTGSAGMGGGFAKLAAGTKHYGGGRSAPTVGPVDRKGYIERDAAIRARRNAILRQLTQNRGQYLSPGRFR